MNVPRLSWIDDAPSGLSLGCDVLRGQFFCGRMAEQAAENSKTSSFRGAARGEPKAPRNPSFC